MQTDCATFPILCNAAHVRLASVRELPGSRRLLRLKRAAGSGHNAAQGWPRGRVDLASHCEIISAPSPRPVHNTNAARCQVFQQRRCIVRARRLHIARSLLLVLARPYKSGTQQPYRCVYSPLTTLASTQLVCEGRLVPSRPTSRATREDVCR